MSLALSLLLSGAALAADHELGLELGTLHAGDPSYDRFDRRDALPSRGVRAGFAVHDHVAVIAGWHRVRRGADVVLDHEVVGRNALRADELTLGAKVDYPVTDYLLPYVSLQGMALWGRARFDDDTTDDKSPGQVRAASIAPGLLAMGGVEVRLPPTEGRRIFPALGLEAGYGWSGPLDLGPAGDVQPRGFAMRGGIGIRY